jgi:hypothetical protein
MTTTRVYLVTEKGSDSVRLIRATHASTAIRHAAGTRFDAHRATHDELEKHIVAGVRVEFASDLAPEQMQLPSLLQPDSATE